MKHMWQALGTLIQIRRICSVAAGNDTAVWVTHSHTQCDISHPVSVIRPISKRDEKIHHHSPAVLTLCIVLHPAHKESEL